MAKRKKPVKMNYTNDLGQEIKPGDEIIIVTTQAHSTSIYYGSYLGKTEDDTDSEYEASCIVSKMVPTRWQQHKVTGEKLDTRKHKAEHLVEPTRPEFPEILLHSNSALWGRLKTSEQQKAESDARVKFQKQQAEYYLLWREYNEQYQKWVNENFEWKTSYKPTRSTLQRNRIYLTGTTLKKFGKININ